MGWGSVFLLSIIPLFFWIFQQPISDRFSTNGTIGTSLGQIFGLTGMAMFSLVLILSSRLKVFEKVFWGINESYIIHHFFGGITFSLLLFHPLLLLYKYVFISYRQAALFLLPSSYWPQNFGILALLVMTISLTATFYLKVMLKYQNWKFLHQFLGVAFVLAFLHVFLIGSDIAQNHVLKIYMFVLSLFAVAAFLYRTVFGALLVKKYKYKVEKVIALPDSTFEVRLAPSGPVMNFFSGQFVFITLGGKNIPKETHPFTVSSAPGQGVRLSIKESGDWTRKIKNLEEGVFAKIEGPYGKFNFRNFKNKKQIWIAGGIGVTPFLSMARDFGEADREYDIDFYYSVKSSDGFIFKEELEKISDKFKNLKITFWVTDRDGFIAAEKILQNTKNANERDILVCGPPVMMTALKAQFLRLGINAKQVHTEEFQL